MTEDIIHYVARFTSNQVWWQLCLILLAAVPLITIAAVWRRPEILQTITACWGRRQAEKKVGNCPHSWNIYVNIAICSLCEGQADADLVLNGKREQLPDLVITANHSQGTLEPIIQQFRVGIRTANITGAKKKG